MPSIVHPTGSPPISVIVVAHTRKEFLRAAIDSLLAQKLDRNLFEIVVVKNFSDDTIDSYLEAVGAQNIVSDAMGGSPKLAIGIQRSRGVILTFLEDDDSYEPERLRRIYDVFQRHPGLGYYHNGLLPIDAAGHAINGFQARVFRPRGTPNGQPILLEDDEKRTRSGILAGQLADFNISATAVHRRVIERALPYLARMFLCADSLIFFAALTSNASILLESDPLTRYRIHGQNISLGGKGTPGARVKRLLDFAVRADEDYRIVRELVVRMDPDRFLDVIDARIWMNNLGMAFRSDHSRRRDFARLLRDFPRFSQTYVIRENWLGIVGIGVYLVSPNWGRRLYQRRRSRI